MGQSYAPYANFPAASAERARSWSVARSGDMELRLLSFLMTVAAAMLSWQIVRSPSLNVTLSDVAFFVVLSLLLVRGRLERLPFGNLTALWLLGLALMQGGLLISTLIAGDPLRWLNIFTQYLFAYVLLPSILMSVPRALVWRCVVAFVLGVTASQAITLLASFFFDYHDTYGIFGLDFITATGRIGAFSGNANTNGGMIAFALLMLIFAMGRRLIKRWQALGCGAILLLALISTASFTAFVAAGIGVSALALVYSPSRFLVVVLPIGVLVGAYLGFGLPVPEAFENRVGHALTSGDLSSAGTYLGRMEILKEAWNLSGGTILVGYGADQYRHVSSSLAPVHVFPMLILVEGGLIALIGLLTMFCILLGLTLRALRIDRLGGAVALAVLIEFLVFSLSVPHMYARHWIGPVFLALAAVYAVPRQERRGPGFLPKQPRTFPQ